MSVNIIYKKILNLELWHDYYLGQPDPPELLPASYDISNLLVVIPTPDCLRILKNLRWVFRPQPQGATIFASVDQITPGNFQTQVPVDQPYRLTFWLVVRDRYFTNFTNLPLATTQNQIYYFSNLSNNQGHALFLTQPLPSYSEGQKYPLGQLITYENKTLEAMRYPILNNGSPNIDDDWKTLPSSQYVSILDSLPRQNISRKQTISAANPGDTFRFTLVDMNAQETFAIEVTVPDTHPPGASIIVNLNFAGQHFGRYQLSLNGTLVDEFVLVEQTSPQQALGLVELILNQNLVPPAFSLLQLSAGQTFIQPKTYVIRFKNRATYWRYRYEQPHHATEENPPPEHFFLINPDFTVLNPTTYVTKKPIGLRRQPEQLLNDGQKSLPIPTVTLIKPEIDATQQVANIFSDVHL